MCRIMASDRQSPTLLFDAVVAILGRWTVVKLALEHGFAHDNPDDRRSNTEILKEFAYELMLVYFEDTDPEAAEPVFRLKDRYDVEPQFLQDWIDDFLEDELYTVAEDGSSKLVASHICDCFQKWLNGALDMSAFTTPAPAEEDAAMEETAEDAEERPRGPIIDDDGFELVQPRRRK